MIVEWCDSRRMTLFHHLKLKRPRMNSADHAPMSPLNHPPRKKRALGNGTNDTDTSEIEVDLKEGQEEDRSSDPPLLECVDESDASAMPHLERQNSVFDGGGGLPHLSPQLWPPSNTLAYNRHFGHEEEEPPPPPLLMGDVLGRGKTMVWTRSPALPRAPPSSTITSPTATPTPKRQHSPTSPQLEPAQALLSMYRPPPPQQPSSSSFRSESGTTDEESSAPAWPDTSGGALNLSVASTSKDHLPKEEDGQPMVCMICEDRATGLHYGIITCEGCKGFFKRTVQNKRVYTCVSDGNCEVTKAQRNRCQYCRFQKCVRQGMVLAAVREDRMPGGRNSGAVYNLYKVKYKKHRRGQRNGHLAPQEQPQQQQQQPSSQSPSGPLPPSHQPPQQRFSTSTSSSDWANGQILKAALTSPADVQHLRPHRTDSSAAAAGRGSSLGGGAMSAEQACAMIRLLVECDAFEEVARLKNARELLQRKLELNDKLCHIGDNIVYKLVQWTKRLPFYDELPVALHTQLLTHKWHELLVLTTCAFLAIRGGPGGSSVAQTVSSALGSLKECLTVMVGEPVGLEELDEAGPLVERLARLADNFRRMALCMEEYVCLKVIIMQSAEELKEHKELEAIHERYVRALQAFVAHSSPGQTGRFQELLACIPEVRAAAALVVHSKMFYVPLFLNTSLEQP